MRVLILTTFDLDEYVYRALRAGASGFLLKDRPPEELVAAVHAVAAGTRCWRPVTRRLIEEFASRPDAPRTASRAQPAHRAKARSSPARSRNVEPEIAQELVVAETTVKTHVGRVLQKLDLRDRVQAVVLAYESGLVHPGAA